MWSRGSTITTLSKSDCGGIILSNWLRSCSSNPRPVRSIRMSHQTSYFVLVILTALSAIHIRVFFTILGNAQPDASRSNPPAITKKVGCGQLAGYIESLRLRLRRMSHADRSGWLMNRLSSSRILHFRIFQSWIGRRKTIERNQLSPPIDGLKESARSDSLFLIFLCCCSNPSKWPSLDAMFWLRRLTSTAIRPFTTKSGVVSLPSGS